MRSYKTKFSGDGNVWNPSLHETETVYTCLEFGRQYQKLMFLNAPYFSKVGYFSSCIFGFVFVCKYMEYSYFLNGCLVLLVFFCWKFAGEAECQLIAVGKSWELNQEIMLLLLLLNLSVILGKSLHPSVPQILYLLKRRKIKAHPLFEIYEWQLLYKYWICLVLLK